MLAEFKLHVCGIERPSHPLRRALNPAQQCNDRLLTRHGDGGDGVDGVGEEDVVAGREVELDGLGRDSQGKKLIEKLIEKFLEICYTVKMKKLEQMRHV